MKPLEIFSFNFVILASITIAVYYLLTPRAQVAWLLIVSYFFYATWGWQYLIVLLFMTISNHRLAQSIGKTKSKSLFLLSLALNIIPLLALKALNGPYGFSLLTVLYNEEQAHHLTSILLPVGFSFYVLQIISYLTDIYRSQIAPEGDLINFALYLAYFPKMLAGPIERAKTFMPQIARQRRVDREALERGLYLILIGILRKIVIADRLAAMRPADVFSALENYAALEKLVWLLVFAFTLYNDFAGYTSIVRGISSLLGIELSANFLQPFFARSFSDFWTRWHITLSEWLRDYIFYPSRRWILSQHWKAWLALLIPPLLTMFASGYWHGVYLSILIWGFLHGLYLVMEQSLQRLKIIQPGGLWARIYGIATFVLITLAWIPFAAANARAALRYAIGFLPPYTASFEHIVLPDLILLPLLSLYLDWQEQKQRDSAFPMKWTPRAQAWAVAIVIILLLLLIPGENDISKFIYQGY